MATTLIDGERRQIAGAIDKVFQRALWIECPIKTPQQFDALWYAAYEPNLVSAYQTLVTARLNFSYLRTLRMEIHEGETKVWFTSIEGDRITLNGQAPTSMTSRMLEAARITWDDYRGWIETVSSLDERIVESIVTLRQILEIANTVGQLQRMVPELLQYLPQDKQDALQKQERHSGLSRAWTNFDRSKVTLLTHTLATCYLLPAREAPSSYFEKCKRRHWARAPQTAMRLMWWKSEQPRWAR